MKLGRFSLLVSIAWVALLAGQAPRAEEPIHTPSEQMKEAVGKLNKSPATIGKSLQDLTEAAKAKLKQAFGGQSKPSDKNEQLDLDVPKKKNKPNPTPLALPEKGRDPFQPYKVKPKTTPRQELNENLPPLERYEIGELKLVGIAGYEGNQDWKALVLAPDKKSYTLSIGTIVGPNQGRVKTIDVSEVVFEEHFASGRKSKTPTTWSCKIKNFCLKPNAVKNAESGK